MMLSKDGPAPENKATSEPELAAGETASPVLQSQAEADPGRRVKKLLAGGLLGAIAAGILAVRIGAGFFESEPVPVVVDEVKPDLAVGEVKEYGKTWIEDHQEQILDDTDRLLKSLNTPGNQLVPSPGAVPDWVGPFAPSWKAVPSTGRVRVVGGELAVDDAHKPAASSEDVSLNPEPAGAREDASEAGSKSGVMPAVTGGKLKDGLKSVIVGGVVSGIVVDRAIGAAKGAVTNKINEVTGAGQ